MEVSDEIPVPYTSGGRSHTAEQEEGIFTSHKNIDAEQEAANENGVHEEKEEG